MRLQLLSDVHVEFQSDAGKSFIESLDPSGADVLVLAGDIAVGPGIVPALGAFCSRFAGKQVVYVHGNHEFYGSDRGSVLRFTEDAVRANSNLVWLDASLETIGGQRFLGGPLWFRPDPNAERYKRAMADFGQISDFESWVYAENQRLIELLERELRPGDIVVTHHLPTPLSVAAQFSASPLNAFFLCDVEPIIRERRPRLWLHGHTHESVDCRVSDTRVVCNPYGYAGVELNREFKHALLLDTEMRDT